MKFLVLLSMFYIIGAAPVENVEETELELLRRLVDLLLDSKKDDLDHIDNILVNKRMKWAFKEEHSEDVRTVESSKIRAKYPDRIPVVVEKAPRSNIAGIDKRKFLVPADLTVAQFMYIIRKRIELPTEDPMFLFVNKVLPATSASIGTIYEEHKDVDGFLYIAYSGENTFGKRFQALL